MSQRNGGEFISVVEQNQLQAHFWRINVQASLIWVIFMAKDFHNGANIIAKHIIINFQGEEILDFLMAPTVKRHLSVLAQKIQALKLGA